MKLCPICVHPKLDILWSSLRHDKSLTMYCCIQSDVAEKVLVLKLMWNEEKLINWHFRTVLCIYYALVYICIKEENNKPTKNEKWILPDVLSTSISNVHIIWTLTGCNMDSKIHYTRFRVKVSWKYIRKTDIIPITGGDGFCQFVIATGGSTALFDVDNVRYCIYRTVVTFHTED